MYAVYARQSVEKKDSVSIEMQVEMCLRAVPLGEKNEIFTDKGYSGTNIKRPAFRKMLDGINQGRYNGIVLYKLDRISRSLSDFARLMDIFEKKSVCLISCTEGIDTNSPMGQMLVKLLIMFAEMEQKTISARISDNYLARAGKLMALGGKPPLGFTADWKTDKVSSHIVRKCFDCIISGESLDSTGRIMGKSGTQVGRIIRNPAYAEKSQAVITFLEESGCTCLCESDCFNSSDGIRLIKSKGKNLIIPSGHCGFISAEIWLAANERLRDRRPSSNNGCGKSSWLCGLIICGKCGGSCYVRNNGRGGRYLTCCGKRCGKCVGLSAVRIQPVENFAQRAVINRMSEIMAGQLSTESVESTEILEIDVETDSLLRNGGSIGRVLYLQHRRQLLCFQQKGKNRFQHPDVELWKSFPHKVKKAAAELIIRKIIVTEEKVTIILD